MKKLQLSLIPLFAAVLAISITACKKDDVQPNTQSQQNEFKVRMTDAPGDYAGLDVEITSVEAYLEDEGWVTLNNDAQVVSVLDLTNGNETTIAYQGSVSAGLYTKLRLTFGNQTNLMLFSSTGSGTLQANLDWGATQQVVIEIDEEVSDNSSADVLLDFQVSESIIQLSQQYIINPVITEIEDESTGLQGEVQGAASAMVVLSDGQNEFSTFINAQGNFLLRGIPEGTYNLIVQEMDAGDNLQDEIELSGVIITEGQISQAGTIQF
jgi:hypothetical protein